MIGVVLGLALVASLVFAWRASFSPPAPASLRRRLAFALGSALLLRVGIAAIQAAPAGALRTAAALMAALAAISLAWWVAHLALAGPYRRGGRTYRLAALALASMLILGGQRGAPAMMFLVLALTRFPWLGALTTGERFRALLALLIVAIVMLAGGHRVATVDAIAADSQAFAWVVRGVAIFYAAIGTLRAFGAFTSDPTLGVRRVSRRLALSHVLVVVIPLLIVVTLWVSSTYLGVNADRALVAARAVDREAQRIEESLRLALRAGGDPATAAAAVAGTRRDHWPGTRAFVIERGDVRRVAGAEVEGEAALAGWCAGLDSLTGHGIVQIADRRWLGAASGDSLMGLAVLVPVEEALDSTLSALVGARVSMRALLTRRAPLDSLAAELEGVRDSLRTASGVRAAGDSAALERVRRLTRRFGVPDSVVRGGSSSSPLRVSAGNDTLDVQSGEIGVTGQALAKGLTHARGRWVPDLFALTARASFGSTLAGMFANVRENPLQGIPIAALAGLALLLFPIAQTDLKMVRGMGRSITEGIAALRDGARAFGAGKLEHRIPLAGDDDLWDTARQFNQMAEDLERARELEKERDRLENELELARRIQARLLPSAPPAVEGLDVAGLSESAREVGGDYYDHIALGGGRLLLVIADVSGKGVPAALLMSGFRASLMSQDTSRAEPAAVASRLNDFLHRSVEPGRFVTAFVGFLDSATGRLVYVNAGHNPPVLLRRDGSTEMLTQGGLILGIMPDSPFTSGEVVLEPGDLVALYTDGVTEGANAANEQWGDERLVASLRAAAGAPAAQIAERIVREVRAFEGESGPADDITVLIARRAGGA